MGTSMAFFNMNQGDAPVLKKLALEFSIADNYHQAVMGGTGAQHIMIGTGDVYFFNNSFFQNGVFNANSFNPAPPPPVPGAMLGLPPEVHDFAGGESGSGAWIQQRLQERHRCLARRIRQLRRRHPARRSGDQKLPDDAALPGLAQLRAQHVLRDQQLLPRLTIPTAARRIRRPSPPRGTRATSSSFRRRTCRPSATR